MTLAMVLRARTEGLPLPARHGARHPMVGHDKTGDTFFTNEKVDNILVSNDGWLGDAAKLYANGHDLKDPQLSPVYGDLSGFPPTILQHRAPVTCSCPIRYACIANCVRPALSLISTCSRASHMRNMRAIPMRLRRRSTSAN